MKNYSKTRIRILSRIKRRLLYTLTLLIVLSPFVNAQEAKINLSFKDTTLEAVMNEIRNQSNVNLVFNHEEIRKAKNISIDVKNVSVEEALRISLRNSGFEYRKVSSNFVVVPKKEEPKPNKEPEVITQTLRGRVVDRESKAPLSFANVIVMNTNPQMGTMTDADGYFKIEDLPVGRYSLQVSYVGYENAVIPEILVGSAKEVVLNIEISERLENIDELVVSVKKGQALNEMAVTSAKSFSVEETKRYAASISDPARMAQVFAGVSTNDDASNEIVIRGNSPNWMLWKLEGVEIPSPNHFAEEGYTAGAVSILSTNMLGKSDFYTGAFPAEFGNALSGVFDIKLRNGNEEKREYSFQLGLLGAEFSTEGPFKKGYRGSYLVSYRYSTFSLLNNMNIEVSENALPNYQDLSFKVNLPTKKAGNFSIWGIGGLSDSDEKFLPDTLLDQKLVDGYSDYTETGMYATGITHTYFPDNKSYIKTVVSNSMSFSSETYDEMNEAGIMEDKFFDDLKSSAFRLNSIYNRKISGKMTARAGVTVSKLSYDYLSQSTDSLGIWDIQIDGSGDTELYQGFLQSKYKFSDNILLTAGMHYTHFALNDKNSFEPRLGLLFNLNGNQKIGIGYGHHSKIENLPTYFVEFENPDGTISYLNQDLELTRSVHYVLSYENLLFQDLGFKTELYYQDISRLPVPNNPEKPLSPAFSGVNPDDTLVSKGVGKNYGIEFSLQKYFTNNYYFLITSSIFESKYKPLNGRWYNTRFNVNYVNNFVGGKEIEWGENKMLSLNAKVLWSGGKRFIPVDLSASIEEGEAVYSFIDAYSQKADDYFRVDLGFKIHFFRQKSEHIIALDIQNVTNRLNTWTQIYDSENQKIINYPMAGIIPVLNYRIEF